MAEYDEIEEFDRTELDAAIAAGDFEGWVQRAHASLDAEAWTAFAGMVADAQNAGDINLSTLLAAAENGEFRYAVQTLLSAIVPTLNCDIGQLLALVATTTGRTRGSGTPYYMMNAFSEWSDRAEARVDRALAAIRNDMAPRDLLVPTLAAGLRVAQRRYVGLMSAMLIGISDVEANAAAFSLGNMQPLNTETAATAIAALRTALDFGGESRMGENLGALLTLDATIGDGATTLAAVKSLAGRSTAGIRLAAANALFLNKVAATDPDLVEALCVLLRDTRRGEAETIGAIDHALYSMISDTRAEAALALLKDLLRAGAASLSDLDSTAHKLRSEAPLALETIAADWLAECSYELTEAVTDLITTGLGDPLALDLDFTGFVLTANQAAAIARRVVASLILHPIAAIAILLSLAKTGPAEALRTIEQIMLDPLLISYWDGPRKYLEERSSGEPAAINAMIKRLLGELRNYVAAIEAAGSIAEMWPSERHRFIAAVQRQEEQRAITEGARQGSLASLFPVSVLLYGDSAVSEVFSGDGTPARREFRMGTVEHSQEIPRLDRIDPVGLWLQRRMFSMGKPRA
jgi:hypothetical protein